MKKDEYITREVIDQLSARERSSLAKYFALIGYNKPVLHNHKLTTSHRLLLHLPVTNLGISGITWCYFDPRPDKRALSLEEVRKMAELGSFYED